MAKVQSNTKTHQEMLMESSRSIGNRESWNLKQEDFGDSFNSRLEELKMALWGFTVTSKKADDPQFKAIKNVALKYLSDQDITYKNPIDEAKQWKIVVTGLENAGKLQSVFYLEHTILHQRQTGVKIDMGVDKPSDDFWKIRSIRVGERPPTSNNPKTCKESYSEKYLLDHSLRSTRMIHTIATVAGIATGIYGILNGKYWMIPLGILGIYEAGFHSHLFVEGNIPTSTEDPIGSVYSDLRVTVQTILNPITGGMDKDLKKAGIYNVR